MKHLSRTGALVVCLLLFTMIASAQSTAEDLMKNVLKAIETNDRQALKSHLVSDQDVKDFVWPSISGVLRSSMNADQYVQTNARNSDAGLTDMLNKFGGKKWMFVNLTLPEPKKKGQGYQIFDAPLLTVRDQLGMESSVRIVGGILERRGIYKVTSYYVSPTAK